MLLASLNILEVKIIIGSPAFDVIIGVIPDLMAFP
jgi:hypothetical protein